LNYAKAEPEFHLKKESIKMNRYTKVRKNSKNYVFFIVLAGMCFVFTSGFEEKF